MRLFLIVFQIIILNVFCFCSKEEDSNMPIRKDIVPALSFAISLDYVNYIGPDILATYDVSIPYSFTGMQNANIKVGFNDTNPNEYNYIVDTIVSTPEGELLLELKTHPRYYDTVSFMLKVIMTGFDSINNMEIQDEKIHRFNIKDENVVRIISVDPDTISFNIPTTIRIKAVYRKEKSVVNTKLETLLSYSGVVRANQINERNNYTRKIDTVSYSIQIPIELFEPGIENYINVWLDRTPPIIINDTSWALASDRRRIYFIEDINVGDN